MPSDSASDPKTVFFELFQRHWSEGTGRQGKIDRRYASWKTPEFLNAMQRAGNAIDNDTLANWLNRRNVPQPTPKTAILKVFFPLASEGKGDTPDDAGWRVMEAAWQEARDVTRPRRGRPVLPSSALPGAAPGAIARQATIAPRPAGKLAGFISYAHDDIALFREFQTHLKTTERVLGAEFWADPDIHAGRHWRPEIQRRIDAAQVFLLLASHNYLASDFINDEEYPAIKARLDAPGTLAIPVILLPCGWKGLLGHFQAVPTRDGQAVPIARWEPTPDGYNTHDGCDRAREQIEASLAEHFGLRRRDPGNPFNAAGQDPAGIRWMKQDDQFTRDTEGGLSDDQAATDPTVAQLHQDVTRQAAHFAQTATRLDNAPGWKGIGPDARDLAKAVRIATTAVPGRIATVYAAIVKVASFLDMDKRLREPGSHAASPLDPEVARELGNLVDAAAIWIRQFPTARARDDALLRWRGAELRRADATTLIQRAQAQQVVPDADAETVKQLLDAGERSDDAGEKAALHAVLGLLNLLYRIGALITEEARNSSADPGQAPSVLAKRGRAFLDVPGPEITRFITDLPADIKHAFARLLAGEPVGSEEQEGEPEPIEWPGKPDWADAAGTDRYGAWASFSVQVTVGAPVTQRLRWIPRGRFTMGSPDDEDGRFDDEGPRHEVTIADGFWLFETACTEALWQAVTGEAPRRSRGAAFPVTEVSWEDAGDFVQRLNDAKPGLALRLPSEARWEYACRAGAETPYSFGTEISKALVCYESSEPVPVGSLPPNRWGLHEMHGNVLEWCADDWHGNYEGAPTDGSAWIDRTGAASRVIRGGSWNHDARDVRSASRNHVPPAARFDDLGFRCARVQSGSEGRQAERRAGRSKPSERSETAATTSPKRRR